MSTVYDVAVVGAGVAGLGASWHLTETCGKKVLLLEQFPVPHQFGSSAGHSRITRELYNSDYNCRLAADANSMWRQLEQKTGMQLFIQNGLLQFGSPKAMCLYDDAVRGIAARHLCPSDPADTATLAQFSGLSPNAGSGCGETAAGADNQMRILLDPNAGVLRADRCLQALLTQSVRYGLDVHEMEKVLKILPTTDGTLTVVTDQSKHCAKAVIICAGTWSGPLLESLGCQLPLQPVKIHYSYHRSKPGSGMEYNYRNTPSFMYVDDHIYGMCGSEIPGCFKIGDFSSDPIDPDQRDKDEKIESSSKSRKTFLQRTGLFMSRFMPEADLDPVVVAACVITRTPDEQPIIDRLPSMPNVIIGCGFNGSGFKTGVIHGQMMAELAVNKNYSTLKQFSIDRFLQRPKL